MALRSASTVRFIAEAEGHWVFLISMSMLASTLDVINLGKLFYSDHIHTLLLF